MFVHVSLYERTSAKLYFVIMSSCLFMVAHIDDVILVRAPAIEKTMIGGQRVAEISFIHSAKRTYWKLENQCLVNFKSCKSV